MADSRVAGRTVAPVAVVVPSRDARWLSEAVAAIEAGRVRPREVVVVDDGSREPVGGLDCTVIRTPGLGRGPARNCGARRTSAPLLWFVDADVRVAEDTLERLWHALDDSTDACMATYADSRDRGYEGFRLVHHRYHVLRQPRPHHLSAACLLIRRACFEALGGFPHLPAMEDIALGLEGHRRGFRWRSVPQATVEHLPRADVWQVLRRDHRERGMAAVRLARRGRPVLEHAASPREGVAALASTVCLASLPLARFAPAGRRGAAAALALWLWADSPWLRYSWTRRGARFALASVWWLLVFRTVVGLGAVRGLVGAGR